MKQGFTSCLCLLFGLMAIVSKAQNVSGYWLGITYPTDPNQVVYNYAMNLTQTGSALGGTVQTSDPDVPFGGVAYLSGQVTPSFVTFSEADKNGSTEIKDLCFWRGKLTYNPADESLIGTYENITNGTTCKDSSGGKVELYRIVLKSGTTFCKGSPVNLVVTGKNIKWYSSKAKTSVLATGNTYSPKLTQTTTFYITQTLYKNESPPVPVTVELVEPVFKTTIINTDCVKTNGSVAITGSTNWQYSLNGGSFQTTPLFTSLSPGSYTIVAKDTAGCQSSQTIALSADASPTITDLKVTPPHCAVDNGEVTVVATGGKAPLTYSINYGVTFQSIPLFTRLAGGTYTLRVHDANGCEVNGAINIPAFIPMEVLSTNAVPTSCGQANGQVAMTIGSGTPPIQYSIDGNTFQSATIFTALKSATYTLVAKDGKGCTIKQDISVAPSTGPRLDDVIATPAGCGEENGAISMTGSHVTRPTDYSLDGQTYQRSADFSGLKAGNYVITARDTNNCVVTQSVLIALDCPRIVHIPTAFSPNADQINDVLTVHFAFPSITISRFTVYDRWGVVLYNRTNFVLSTGEPIWDGQVDGHSAPAGMYVYRLDCQFPDGTQTSYHESVALLNQ